MTVKECVRLAAVNLGIAEEVNAFLNGENSQSGQKKTELLLSCFNTVENELALDYLPLIAEDTVSSDTGVVQYGALENSVVRVIAVFDQWGEAVKFNLFPAYLKTQPGQVKIRYAYTPVKKDIDGVSDYETRVSARLVAYGMAEEYALTTGLFEEGAVWNRKYKEAIEAAYATQPCARIRSRRWA